MMFSMTHDAESDDVQRVKHAAPVFLDGNNMMNVENASFRVVGACELALPAFEPIALKDGESKLGVSLVAAFASLLLSEFVRESAKIKVRCKPVWILLWVKVPMRLAAPAKITNGSVSRFCAKTCIPRFKALSAKLNATAVGVMSALVFGNAQATASIFVDWESGERCSAPTFTGYGDSCGLSFGNSHVSSLPHAGKIENRVNCWEPRPAMPRAISSQASQECGEGSTTRAWSPERTVKPHERATRKGRYSLVLQVTARSECINSPAITKRPYSGKLEALSKFEVRKPVMQALRNDAGKTIDRASYAQFYLTPLRVVPTGGTDATLLTLTTNGTATLTNNVAFGSGHAKTVVDLMKERNIPAYVGDDYMAIGWPTTFRGLKNTLETLHQYTESGIKLIFNGEIGRYENMRYVEQTNVTKGITATGAGGAAWSNAKSDWIFFFGEDTVAEGIAIPEEMRAKVPTDYGRSKGVAWYGLFGFGIVHTNAVQARIVMWDSAV